MHVCVYTQVQTYKNIYVSIYIYTHQG